MEKKKKETENFIGKFDFYNRVFTDSSLKKIYWDSIYKGKKYHQRHYDKFADFVLIEAPSDIWYEGLEGVEFFAGFRINNYGQMIIAPCINVKGNLYFSSFRNVKWEHCSMI